MGLQVGPSVHPKGALLSGGSRIPEYRRVFMPGLWLGSMDCGWFGVEGLRVESGQVRAV